KWWYLDLRLQASAISSAAKAACLTASNATAEAVTLPSRILQVLHVYLLLGRLGTASLDHRVQRGRVPAQRTGGEQRVLRREDQLRVTGNGGRRALRNLRVLVITGDQVEARDVVAGDQALNFVEHGNRIEGRHAGLEPVRFQPNSVTVRLAGLRAARLAHVGTRGAAEGNQVVEFKAHLVGDANDDLKIRLGACQVAGFAQHLQVAAGVGEGAGLLVRIGRRQQHVGQRSYLRQEHILHHNEAAGEQEWIHAVAGHRVGADDVESLQATGAGGFEHLLKVEPGIAGKRG